MRREFRSGGQQELKIRYRQNTEHGQFLPRDEKVPGRHQRRERGERRNAGRIGSSNTSPLTSWIWDHKLQAVNEGPYIHYGLKALKARSYPNTALRGHNIGVVLGCGAHFIIERHCLNFTVQCPCGYPIYPQYEHF